MRSSLRRCHAVSNEGRMQHRVMKHIIRDTSCMTRLFSMIVSINRAKTRDVAYQFVNHVFVQGVAGCGIGLQSNR